MNETKQIGSALENQNPNLSRAWYCLQASVMVLPLFPLMGEIGLIYVLGIIWWHYCGRIVSNPINWGLGIVSVGLIINSALAAHPRESWLGLANFLPFFILFAALRLLIQSVEQLRNLSWLLGIPSLPIVFIGLIQLNTNWSIPSPIATILGWQIVPEGVPPGRMSSVFIYANFLAVYLAIAFSLNLGLCLENWQIWRQKKTLRQSFLLGLLTVILIADTIGIILTSSRSAWGIAFLSFMAFAVYMGWRWLCLAVTGAVTAIGWASFAPNFGGSWLRNIVPVFIWGRLSDNMYPDRPIATLRITQWQFCWELIQERPLIGWGLRNFTPIYEAQMNVWFGHPHNLFLMLAAETGVIVTLLLVVIVGYMTIESVLFLKSTSQPGNREQLDRLIFFSYLVAFSGCIVFNLFDVTIFDLRINTIVWLLLSAISGVTANYQRTITLQ